MGARLRARLPRATGTTVCELSIWLITFRRIILPTTTRLSPDEVEQRIGIPFWVLFGWRPKTSK